MIVSESILTEYPPLLSLFLILAEDNVQEREKKEKRNKNYHADFFFFFMIHVNDGFPL